VTRASRIGPHKSADFVTGLRGSAVGRVFGDKKLDALFYELNEAIAA
jgi:hypothetical protein